MRMGIGLGVGINRSNYAQGIFGAYATRVVADGGVVEAGQCVDAVSGLLLNASLLLIPSGYKGGKLYAEIPTNGNGDLTWTRGSDAFRTNASGLIQRVPWNLIPNSQVFSSWQKVTVGTTVTVTDNAITAPNGTMTAANVVFSTFSTSAQIYQSIPSPSAGVFTTSIYAKVPSGTKQILFGFFDGTIKTQTKTLTTQWQRIEYSTTLVSFGSSRTCWLYGDDGASNVEIHIWGGQHVEGTTAQTYLPTTDRLNFPRLSYMYGSCPSVLLEPQRTNLALYSEDFSVATYSKYQATITTNTTTSPDGTTNADKIIATAVAAEHYALQNINATINLTYTYSIYLKASEYGWAKIATNTPGSALGAFFNLSTGVVGTTDAGVTASMQSVGNGWYRCVITTTSNSTASKYFVIWPTNSGTSIVYTGDGTSGIFAYGFQVEQGAYPTTYIPTTSATATRVADSFSRNNIYTNGLISASGGTWFVELRGNTNAQRDIFSPSLYIADDTTTQTNGFVFAKDGSTAYGMVLRKRIASVETTLLNTAVGTIKIAIKWNGSTADVFQNGTKVVSATSFTPTNMNFLIGNGNDVPKFIQQMALYPEPKSDQFCIELTTL